MWIVMIKSLRYYIKSLCIKNWLTLMKYTIPPISLTRGRTQFRSVVLYLGSREGIFVFFFSYGASQAKSERRARWTACKDAAGRQTRRATSDHVAHYRRGVFRSLSVPNVFYSDVLLCLRNSRNNGLKCMRFTAI